MDIRMLGTALENVRATTPLVHCITNYVTANDCANALLACGGSPVMADDESDAPDITTACGGLVLNLGTLSTRTVATMHTVGTIAGTLGHPIVLDPVGAGASAVRTTTAAALLDELPITVVRGNMSEVKALSGAAAATRGVDASPDDAITSENLAPAAHALRALAAKLNSIVAVTGAIDLVASADRAVAIHNGSPIMGKITGAGCMLDAIIAAYVTANPAQPFEATVAAVAGWGLAGEIAAERMSDLDGNASFRTYLIDAAYNLTAAQLMAGAQIEDDLFGDGVKMVHARRNSADTAPTDHARRNSPTAPSTEPICRSTPATSPTGPCQRGPWTPADIRHGMRLYAVTDSSWLHGRTLAHCVEQALANGATFVQLREKHATTDELVELAATILPLCRAHHVPFVIDDDVEAALRSGADGVHVGQSDTACAEARRVLGPDAIIGVSAQTVEAARAAEAAGADYLGVGALIPTPTKPDAVEVTPQELARICQAVSIPVVGIGGLHASTLDVLAGTGVDGAAVVSAIFAADDIPSATHELAGTLDRVLPRH